MCDITIFRVYVLKPLKHRDKKHAVMIYRVGAKTKESAIETVRQKIINCEIHQKPGSRIVACTEFGPAQNIVTDGVVYWDKTRANSAETL